MEAVLNEILNKLNSMYEKMDTQHKKVVSRIERIEHRFIVALNKVEDFKILYFFVLKLRVNKF